MRCNLSKNRLMDTLVFDAVKLYDDARFGSYTVNENLLYNSLLKEGYDSVKAAFIAGYYCGHINTKERVRTRLSYYYERLKKIEIKRSLKRIKEIKGGSLW